jgi:hypothetical protein
MQTRTYHAEARGGVGLDDEDAQKLEEAGGVHLLCCVLFVK